MLARPRPGGEWLPWQNAHLHPIYQSIHPSIPRAPAPHVHNHHPDVTVPRPAI
ncbi:uncharacterized protein B0I36DRAFT_337380, partial [Microdochium trichocladiopsis]